MSVIAEELIKYVEAIQGIAQAEYRSKEAWRDVEALCSQCLVLLKGAAPDETDKLNRRVKTLEGWGRQTEDRLTSLERNFGETAHDLKLKIRVLKARVAELEGEDE